MTWVQILGLIAALLMGAYNILRDWFPEDPEGSARVSEGNAEISVSVDPDPRSFEKKWE